jgi:rhodanese-related sulfurtransferase
MLLAEARRDLVRLTPIEAEKAMASGALLVDIRSETQRASDGEIPGAKFIPRNVLEWRLDPACEARDPELASHDRELIVFCNEGYQSSLAAATIRRMGIDATDLIGGFQAWRDAGLEVVAQPRRKRV